MKKYQGLRFSPFTTAVIPMGIAINIAIGSVVYAIKVPVYLDAVGTILVALLCGPIAGVVTGVLSFLINGMLTNPVLPWFIGTQAAIALYVGWMAKKGFFSSLPRVVFAGISLGVVAGMVSAPVITYLFGGITGSGASLVVAYFLASGETLINSVLLSGLAAEPIDKTIQCLVAYSLITKLPKFLLAKCEGKYIRKNFEGSN